MQTFPVTFEGIQALSALTGLSYNFADEIEKNQYSVFMVDVFRDACYLCQIPKDYTDKGEALAFEDKLRSQAKQYKTTIDGIAQEFVLAKPLL